MKSIVLTAMMLAAASVAMAEPACSAPKDKWMPEAQFKKQVEGQGYQIKTFKVNKGQCYEVYGIKDGKKVEHFFDPATGAQVTK
jgi:hypothetical protein